MLAYLDSLCTALAGRNDIEVRRLLAHPLARHLPRRVRDEALTLSRGSRERPDRPAMLTMEFRHQLAHMLADETNDPPPSSGNQLELPLRLPPEGPASSVSVARAATRGPTKRRAG